MDERLSIAVNMLLDMGEIARKTAAQNGWKPNTFRKVPEGGGFAIEHQVFSSEGVVSWKRVFWSVNEKDANNALNLRRQG